MIGMQCGKKKKEQKKGFMSLEPLTDEQKRHTALLHITLTLFTRGRDHPPLVSISSPWLRETWRSEWPSRMWINIPRQLRNNPNNTTLHCPKHRQLTEWITGQKGSKASCILQASYSIAVYLRKNASCWYNPFEDLDNLLAHKRNCVHKKVMLSEVMLSPLQ